MSALLAGTATAAAVLAATLRPRLPNRLRTVVSARPEPTTGSAAGAFAATVGRPLRRVLGRPADPVADRRAGLLVGAVVAAVAVDPVVAVLGIAIAALRARWRAARAQRRGPSERAVVDDLPEVTDLVALAVGAGLTVPAALPVVAEAAPPALRAGLVRACDAVARGESPDRAVARLGDDWGEAGRPLVQALTDHLRYGTAVVPVLERVGAEARAHRRRAAEQRARRLPVLLLFPLVLCTLPAFGLLTVAPLVAGTLGSLDTSPLEADASLDP